MQGPPGTGKTRFIRAVLAAISRRNGVNAEAVYTADEKVLEGDEIFADFLTGYFDVFVVEDADHILRPRSGGNTDLHRFLTVAEGVVTAQGRKVMLTTNLPNIRDLDDALVRPGRCFARLILRRLKADETGRLLERLCFDDAAWQARAAENLDLMSARSFSVAEVYRALRETSV